MCPKLIELLSWNDPTVHVCCFMLARASTKTFISRIHIRQPSPKMAKKIFVSQKIRQQVHSLAEQLLSKWHKRELKVCIQNRRASGFTNFAQLVERGMFRTYLEHMYERSRNMQLLKESMWKEASSKSYLVLPDSSYGVFPGIKLICDIQYR